MDLIAALLGGKREVKGRKHGAGTDKAWTEHGAGMERAWRKHGETGKTEFFSIVNYRNSIRYLGYIYPFILTRADLVKYL